MKSTSKIILRTFSAIIAITLIATMFSGFTGCSLKELSAKNQYKKILNSYPDSQYALIDLDNDKYPELIVRIGTCEADTQYVLFDVNNKSVASGTPVATFGWGNSSLCGLYRAKGDISLLFCFGHMGYESLYEYKYDNSKLYQKATIYEDRRASYEQPYLSEALTSLEFCDVADGNISSYKTCYITEGLNTATMNYIEMVIA